MNSVKNQRYCLFFRLKTFCILIFSVSLVFTFSAGCGDQIKLPSNSQLSEFEDAGPEIPSVDMDSLVKAKIAGSQYRVKSDDVLELTMPAILQAVTKNEYKEDERYAPYICRISESGTVTLPSVGELKVSGKTLAQLETAVIEKYYPDYAVTRPSVYAKVLEYKTEKVSITGAVKQPGVYSLQNDQMTLVNLVMQAGGIIDDGAAIIKVTHSDVPSPDDERITQNKYEQQIRQIPRQSTGKANESIPGNSAINTRINKDKKDVCLSFEQNTPLSTKGILTVKAGEIILLEKKMDIADLQERLFVIKELLNEPRISILQFDRKLNELADNIKQTSSQQAPVLGPQAPGREQSGVQANALRTASSTNPGFKTINLGLYSQDQKLSEIENNQEQENEIQPNNSKTIVLPVKGLNIPFADIVLSDGDNIVVEKLELPLFSVLGLVNKPGNFQYPPDAHYSLMQAIAFANGLDRVSGPRYATIYRLKPDGKIVHASFQVEKVKDRSKLTAAMNASIKPGDIIIVEQTPRTQANIFFERVFRVNIGTYFNLTDVWQ